MGSNFRLTWNIFTVCLFAITLLAVSLFSSRVHPPELPPPIPVTMIPDVKPSLIEASFLAKESVSISPETRLLLLPHHLVAGREIASTLTSLRAPKRVLLLSPDHFSQGKTAFSLARQRFRGAEYTIDPDLQLIEQLTRALDQNLTIDPAVFQKEHGVYGLLPFIHRAWPETSVTALSVRNDSSPQAVQRLSDTLQRLIERDDDLLVIITIDFSHDLPEYVAGLHDALAIDTLRSLDGARVKQIELDSTPLAHTLMSVAKDLRLSNVNILFHTNSLSLMKAETTPLGTSHIIATFSPGASSLPRSVTTTLIHDPRRSVQSSEERFYKGFDRIVTSTIPYPVAFVKIETASSTRLTPLPLKLLSGQRFVPLTDTELKTISTSTKNTWNRWAETHLLFSSK